MAANVLCKARNEGTGEASNFSLPVDATTEVLEQILRDSFGYPRSGGILTLMYTDDDDEEVPLRTDAELRAAVMLVQNEYIRKLAIRVDYTPAGGAGGKAAEAQASIPMTNMRGVDRVAMDDGMELPPAYGDAVAQATGGGAGVSGVMEDKPVAGGARGRTNSIDLQLGASRLKPSPNSRVSPYAQAATAHQNTLAAGGGSRASKKRYEGWCDTCVNGMDEMVDSKDWTFYMLSATFFSIFSCAALYLTWFGATTDREEFCDASYYLQWAGGSWLLLVFSIIPTWYFWLKSDGDINNYNEHSNWCMYTVMVFYLSFVMFVVPFAWALPSIGILFYHLILAGDCVGITGAALTWSLVAYIGSWIMQVLCCCGIAYSVGSYVCEEEN